MSEEAQQKVARYFAYLEDPGSLVDHARVSELKQQAASAGNLMDKAVLLSKLERAQTVDDAEVVGGFVAHAKEWAGQTGVTAKALQDVGVPSEVLAKAGLIAGDSRVRRTRAASGPRRPSVSSDAVQQAVLNNTGTFTYQKVLQDTGASMMTVRKVVDGLVAQNRVRFEGEDPQWGGRGRAPHVFRVSNA